MVRMNLVGQVIKMWCGVLLLVLLGGLFSERLLTFGFMLFTVSLPLMVGGLFFIEFKTPAQIELENRTEEVDQELTRIELKRMLEYLESLKKEAR